MDRLVPPIHHLPQRHNAHAGRLPTVEAVKVDRIALGVEQRREDRRQVAVQQLRLPFEAVGFDPHIGDAF